MRSPARDGAPGHSLPGILFVTTGVLVIALLHAPVGAPAAADATWKTYRAQNCGIELKYPTSYDVEASGLKDACGLWIRIGVREGTATISRVGSHPIRTDPRSC